VGQCAHIVSLATIVAATLEIYDVTKALFVPAFQLAFLAEKQKSETNSEKQIWLL
jgi:hypothetical protein